MTAAELKLAPSGGYQPLNQITVLNYLAGLPSLSQKLGGPPAGWRAREVGDGNLNLVFIVEGPVGGVVVKQALPYVRLVGESWPLPLSRAHFEYKALVEERTWAPEYVPALYHHDEAMALTVME
jgi:5-methylthioribose kinase